MYNHILIGFDDSEDSMKALGRAAQFYMLNPNCKITVAHVIQQHIYDMAYNYDFSVAPNIAGGVYPTQIPVPDNELPLETQETIRDSQILDHAKSFLLSKGVPAKFESLGGKPVNDDLCDFASEQDVDLIIVGNSGKGALKKLLEGSVSEKVMKKAEMDVLIVK
ncbi:universal stress protein [Neobacillus vireti]|uniref:UspA domain-containing protein n=1 Tax=Neobacillus vireti LMG 21834 TaxID=1131730 RepID=A0AB94INF0_9BACI|nr:universal stress protein [Neobacillus vireti]ETI68512.1 UspA domain-containing protein [Neobacillus vireti LMG 21834]